jgi:hypothetical protein
MEINLLGNYSILTNQFFFKLESNMRGWKKLKCSGDIPPQRSRHSGVVHGNFVFIFGGFSFFLKKIPKEPMTMEK